MGLIITPLFIRYESLATTMQAKPLSIDWFGSATFTASITTFLVGLSWGGNSYAWSSAATLYPIVLGIAGLVASLMWERYGARQPFLRLFIFYNRSAVIVYFITILQSLTVRDIDLTIIELGILSLTTSQMYGVTYMATLWLESVKNLSPTLTGVGYLALAGAMMPTSAISGGIIARLGHFRWAIWTGWALTIVASNLLTTLKHSTPTGVWVVIFLIFGGGQGLLLMSQSVAAQTIASHQEAAHTASMYTFCRSLGMCIGVVISGTAFQNLLRLRLAAFGLPVGIADHAEAYVSILKDMHGTAFAMDVLDAYNWALRMFFATIAGIAGLGFVLSFGIGEFSMDRKGGGQERHVLEEEVEEVKQEK